MWKSVQSMLSQKYTVKPDIMTVHVKPSLCVYTCKTKKREHRSKSKHRQHVQNLISLFILKLFFAYLHYSNVYN